jgi:uncharacterized protein with FMN-binding domain
MKRILLSVVGTVLALVALLSFKSHGHPLQAAGGLPSAGLPQTTTSSAPPNPSGNPAGRASTSSAAAATRTIAGGAVQTRYGIVQVQATVSGRTITNVQFLQLTAYDGRSQEINQSAAPILLQETLTAQNSHIDTVSGASYTSDGYIQSLQSALDQAGIQ